MKHPAISRLHDIMRRERGAVQSMVYPDVKDGVLHIHCGMLLGERAREGFAIPEGYDGRRTSPADAAFETALLQAVRDIHRRHLRKRETNDQEMDSPTKARDPAGVPASWTLYAHPATLWALRYRGIDAREEIMRGLRRGNGYGTTLDRTYDMAWGHLSIADGIEVTSRFDGTDLIVPRIPETASAALAGAMLRDAVELPPCGDPMVDEAAGSVRIVRAHGTLGFSGDPNRHTRLRLAPARWRPCAPPPEGTIASFLSVPAAFA